MLHKLDPHSNYIAAKDMKAVNESINAKFGGIGVRFLLLRDTVCVSHVMENSPSLIAGVRSGDKIIEVDGKKMTGKKITNDKVMASLKGEEGTFVKVKVVRKNKRIDIKIRRGAIPIKTITCAYMVDSKVGYILIDQFSIPTADDFRQAALSLKERGMKELIFRKEI